MSGSRTSRSGRTPSSGSPMSTRSCWRSSRRTRRRTPAWSWWEPDQTVGFWYRRMALETVVHRVDVETQFGPPSAIDAALAVDGIDEVLTLMLAGDDEAAARRSRAPARWRCSPVTAHGRSCSRSHARWSRPAADITATRCSPAIRPSCSCICGDVSPIDGLTRTWRRVAHRAAAIARSQPQRSRSHGSGSVRGTDPPAVDRRDTEARMSRWTRRDSPCTSPVPAST